MLFRSLAARGSRLAVYDLKETLTGMTGPLPVGFLAAAAAVGDADCLEPLAHAWLNATDDAWWRAHLTEAFAAIVKREAIGAGRLHRDDARVRGALCDGAAPGGHRRLRSAGLPMTRLRGLGVALGRARGRTERCGCRDDRLQLPDPAPTGRPLLCLPWAGRKTAEGETAAGHPGRSLWPEQERPGHHHPGAA